MNVTTIGDLIQKDLEMAYFLPQQPSSYSKGYKFQNDTKYRVFDSPPPPPSFNQTLFPLRNLATTGDKVTVIIENEPPSCLQEHWKKTTPDFPLASVKSVDEALLDDADMGWCGCGSQIVQDDRELATTITHMRDVCGWDGGIVFQEFIPGVKEVPSFQLHLSRSGEMFWVGTTHGKFDGLTWIAATVDWNKQEEFRDCARRVYNPYQKLPRKKRLLWSCDVQVLFTDNGKYMVDLNPRVGGETSHLLLARYMASEFGLRHSTMFSENTHHISFEQLVQKANGLNEKIEGRIVILAVADEPYSCNSDVSVFAQSPEDVQDIF
ncbi:hypothetical protein AWC38_SpisGene6938 [Stylophora pistillata]|uniref:ATP-grasp domain-containing protein n=1 Tax=Stylophora pistillata TaxID=50429 RepID=A0A2B4SH36_STYPI|nr:hypothetical protein AWC38_SpisGene6938 [Stylophora pistillata]